MTNAHGSTPTQVRRRSRRIDARIDISPASLVLNGEPVEVVGSEPWLAAGIRAAAETLARPAGCAIRVRVVNGPHRTRMVVHPDSSVSDVEEYVLPAWLERVGRVVGAKAVERWRIPLLALAAAGAVCALIGAVVLTSGGQQPAASPTPATTGADSDQVDDLRIEAMRAAITPVVLTARVAGGTGSVAVEAAAEPRAEARWLLRDPDGDVLVDHMVALDTESQRFWHTGLTAGDYRWTMTPSGDGAVRQGTVTVTDDGTTPSTDTAAPDDPTTPGTPDADDPAPDPGTDPGTDPTTREPGGGSPLPDPTTPEPDPTTPEPDPTTPEPDPTTPEPDPTTPEPDPTTPEPDPTTREPDPTTSDPDPTTSAPSASSRSPSA